VTRRVNARLTAAPLCAALLLAACASNGGRMKIEPEAFGSTTTHSRSFATAPGYTCEAARRALLSQGFVIATSDAEHVKGRKHFQPASETHVEIEFNATCAPDGRGGKKTIAFVNALQDRYALKKSNNSASLGVGAFGSLSLPFSSSDDAMVKVASETITSAPFYDRFFTLLQRYLAADSELVEPKNEAPLVIVPQPPSTPPQAPSSAP
jgi:ABC-type amino acid transport substrate-binding protein